MEMYITGKLEEKQVESFNSTVIHRGPSLPHSVSPAGGKSVSAVNAIRCDLITQAYLKVSSGLLARHKIDLHQGQALKATAVCSAPGHKLRFDMQRFTNTDRHTAQTALKTQRV